MTVRDTRPDAATAPAGPPPDRAPDPGTVPTTHAGDPVTPGWQLVAQREIFVKLRDKAFLGSTLFLLVAVAASFGVSAFLDGRTSESTVAVVDGSGAAVVRTADEGNGADRIRAREAADAAEARAWLRDDDVAAALLPLDGAAADGGSADAGSADAGSADAGSADAGSADAGSAGHGARWEVVGDTGVDSDLRAALAAAVQEQELAANAETAGTTAGDVLAGTSLQERLLDADALPEQVRFGVGFAFAMLFYLTALVFGLAIAQSVVEEKQSRVVEILVAAVPVRQLLAGKVVGNSILAIGQVVLLVSVGLLGLSLTGGAASLSPVLTAGGWFVVFFVCGFAALACMWAVAGSVATRQEDLQSTSAPMTTVVMLALFGGLLAQGQAQVVLSFVPLVSTVAMPARMLGGDVALWQPLVALALVLLTAVLLVRLGARLYEGSVLRTDRRIPLREAFARRS